MPVLLRRLEEVDEVEAFDCGDEPVNNYLKRHAWANQQKSSIGVTYVAVDEGAPRTVLGYFTMATASVPRDALPKKYVRGFPSYDLPLILLARLGVDRRFSGKGLGHALISEAFKIALRVADDVGCRCMITDAYRDRIDWYARYGFIPFQGTAEIGPQQHVSRYTNSAPSTEASSIVETVNGRSFPLNFKHRQPGFPICVPNWCKHCNAFENSV